MKANPDLTGRAPSDFTYRKCHRISNQIKTNNYFPFTKK